MTDIPSLTEPDLTRYIFKSVQLYANAIYFIEAAALGHSRVGWSIEAHICVSRDELGLAPDRKPGDIDLLLIPRHGDERVVAKSMAIEVKKFYVPQSKRSKSPNQYGATQTNGLLIDGFPFVGLLHIPIIQPSDASRWKVVPEMGTKLVDGRPHIIGEAAVDIESYNVSRRHHGRFSRFKLDEPVGYNSFALSLDESRSQIVGWTVSDYHLANENPQISDFLLKGLKKFDRSPEFVVEHGLSGVNIQTNDLGL